jgi:UDP-glucose 4-epimerase
VRDYIHVVDLAEGHVAAVDKLGSAGPGFGCRALNLGTGKGTSVLEMLRVWEASTGARVAWEVAPRRPGDAVAVWAATARAEAELGWWAVRGVPEMCRDQWAWASRYPRGFEAEASEARAPEPEGARKLEAAEAGARATEACLAAKAG